jgi:trigger factor
MAEDTKADQTPETPETPENAENIENAETTEQQDNLPAYGIDVEDSGTLKKKIKITVPPERIDAKRDEMYGELSGQAQVPGFRIGRAPRRLLEKRFGKEVANDVRNALVGDALGKAIEETDLKTIGEPDLDLESIELPDEGEMTFSIEVEVMPEFELPKLDDIPVTKKIVQIDDARVDEQVEQWRSSQAHFEESEEPADDDDMVLASAKVSGEGIDEPVERSGLTLRVAPGQVEGLPLVELGDALKGKKAGESAEVKVTAPDSHPNEAWQGKELTVEITVGTVRKRQLPELNDELAQKAGFDSLDDLKGYIRSSLQAGAAQETQQAMRQQIQEYLLENAQFELPEGVVKRHTASVLQRQYVDLLYGGVPREKIDENITRLQAAAGEEAQRQLKLQFILGKIADEKDVQANEGEVNARIAAMAQQYNRRPERLRQELDAEGQLGQVRSSIVEQKVLDELLANADITEAAPDQEGEKAEAGEAKKAKKATKKKAAKSKSTEPKADKEDQGQE